LTGPLTRLTAAPRARRSERAQGVVVLLFGVVLAGAFPGPDVSPLAWVALVPLLVLVGGGGGRRGLFLGASFGVGFFGTLLVWISLVGWLSWAVLVTSQAAFVALFGAGWALAGRARWLVARVLAPPVLWVALVEYLRSVFPAGGFPWGQLAQSQVGVPWLLPLSSLAGGWLVAFAVVLINAAVAEAFRSRSAMRRGVVARLALAIGVVLVAPALVPGSSGQGRPVRVAIVQGGVPAGFEDDTYAKQLAIIERHRRLTARLPPDSADLVVWPESSVGLDLERVPEAARAVRDAARAVKAPLVIGGNLDSGPDRYRVMAFLVSPTGGIVESYQKTHLVPFGEYIPARRWLEWIPMLDQIPRDAVAGDEPGLFEVAGGTVAPVISFEGDFGPLVRARIGRGGRLLVVATNTSTWGRTWASAQHLAFARVRAAENGVWVVHAALSGISGYVAPDAGVFGTIPLGRSATRIATVRFAATISLYARTGDWLPRASVILAVAAVLSGALAGSTAAVRARRAFGPAWSKRP
jgi:apolipoprotein N-acyltransferase